MRRTARLPLAAFFSLCLAFLLSCGAWAQDDVLPSWNEGATRQAILDFVKASTREGDAGFLPESERIAVFDMDGTLIPEEPYPLAMIPIMAAVRESVARKPLLAAKPAVAAFLRGDQAALDALGEAGMAELAAAATDGKSTEEMGQGVAAMLGAEMHPKFGVPYTKAVYRPMRELMDLLTVNGFTLYICSGTPVLITRQVSQQMFGIVPEHVMGTSLDTLLDERDGRTILIYDGRIGHINDMDGKPVTINLALGRRPAFIAGNEGQRGDIAMMRWSRDRAGPSLQLLINHDDAIREYAYSEPDGYSLDAARTYGFHIVSMKDDWKTIIDR